MVGEFLRVSVSESFHQSHFFFFLVQQIMASQHLILQQLSKLDLMSILRVKSDFIEINKKKGSTVSNGRCKLKRIDNSFQ